MNKLVTRKGTPEELIERHLTEAIDSSIKEQQAVNIKELTETYNDIKKTKSNIDLNKIIIDAWQKEKSEERKLKGKYISILAIAFCSTLIFSFVIFFGIGVGCLKFDVEVLNMFMNCIYIELSAGFLYILKELFKNSSQELLNFLNKFNVK